VKKKKIKRMPSVSSAEVAAFRKTEAIMIRVTKEDKQLISSAARKLSLTVTEMVTRAARLVAEKI
jgi:uncharacterized protein (DUF1778 family)